MTPAEQALARALSGYNFGTWQNVAEAILADPGPLLAALAEAGVLERVLEPKPLHIYRVPADVKVGDTVEYLGTNQEAPRDFTAQLEAELRHMRQDRDRLKDVLHHRSQALNRVANQNDELRTALNRAQEDASERK